MQGRGARAVKVVARAPLALCRVLPSQLRRLGRKGAWSSCRGWGKVPKTIMSEGIGAVESGSGKPTIRCSGRAEKSRIVQEEKSTMRAFSPRR
jgi:hypothetical protein